MSDSPPHVAQASDHQTLQWLGQTTVEVLLDAAASGGRLTILRGRQFAGDAAPWHVHGREDETMIMLDGEALVWIGESGQEQRLVSGGVAWMPRDVPHAYVIDSDTADVLFVATPGGLEGFFRHAGHDLTTPSPESWSLTPDALAASFSEHGGTILGPPPDPSAG